MKVMHKLLISFLTVIVTTSTVLASTSVSTPPSTIYLKLPPPKNYQQAFNRIPDYIILNTILPPVINRKSIKKQLFGKYEKEMDTVLSRQDMKELTKLVVTNLKSKKFSLEKLKTMILKVLKKHYLPANDLIPIPILVGVIISVIVVVIFSLLLTCLAV